MKAFLAAAAFLGVAAMEAAAEPVGLEAQGVSPWAALHNRWNLDVRDELNRPVSARKIEGELKAASAQAAADGAYASRLPRARAVARALEMLEGFKNFSASVFAWQPQFSPEQAWALPMLRRGSARSVAGSAARGGPGLVSGAFSCRSGPSDFSPASCRPLVLRC